MAALLYCLEINDKLYQIYPVHFAHMPVYLHTQAGQNFFCPAQQPLFQGFILLLRSSSGLCL